MAEVSFSRVSMGDSAVLSGLRKSFLASQIEFGLLDLPDDPETHIETTTRTLISSSRAFVLLASVGEVPAGYALGISRFAPDSRHKKIGLVDEVFVQKEFRGRGVAAELVTRTVDYFLAEGKDRIQIRALADNTLACQAWAKLGFRPNVLLMEYERRAGATIG